MKKISMLFAAVAISMASYAQTWTVDKSHAKVGFSVSHMTVSDVDGLFRDYDATLAATKPDFSDAKFGFTAKVNSISTENEKRDEHLKSADFFDAEKYPTLSFTSTSVKKLSGNKMKITGNLTMHGVTKVVTFDGAYRGPSENPMSKKMVAGFKVTGKIKRTDFNLSSSTPSAMVGNDVEITANGEFVKG